LRLRPLVREPKNPAELEEDVPDQPGIVESPGDLESVSEERAGDIELPVLPSDPRQEHAKLRREVRDREPFQLRGESVADGPGALDVSFAEQCLGQAELDGLQATAR